MPARLDKQPDMTLAEKGGWWHRVGLHDADFCTIDSAYTRDEYHLTDHSPARGDEVIVDVGACVGAFARLAHVRNPKARIFAIEANQKNIVALEANAGSFATIIPRAMTYELAPALLDSIYDGTEASGGSVVKTSGEVAGYDGSQYIAHSDIIPAVTLEEVLVQHGIDFVDVLKLDCEGSEYSILRGTTSLDRIGVIVGEYHGGRSRWEELVRDRFAPDAWFHMSWNHHDHMGNFLLVNRRSAT